MGAILPPYLTAKAQSELSEIPSERNEQIETLRKAIQSDPNLNFRCDDEFLLRFLRARKFNQERAFQLITNYYKQRRNYPELYGNLSASNMSHILKSNFQGVLSGKDDEGRSIVVFNTPTWDTTIMTIENMTANLLLSLELLIEDVEIQINGIVCVFNEKGFNFSHIRCFYPSALKQIFQVTYNCFPIRFKQVHFLHEPKIFDIVLFLMKPFTSKKLEERFIFHGDNVQSLHRYINPDLLPEELGGKLGPFSNEEWNAKLFEHDVVLKKDLKYGIK